MPRYDRNELDRTAREHHFPRDTFEKVLRLKDTLSFINDNELLSSHLLLKGGTAINLAIFDLPRLSVDIDMDFCPNLPKNEMQDIRREITSLLSRHMESEGYFLAPDSRLSHSLEGIRFKYVNAAGNQDVIKVELNYSLRSHLFDPVKTQMKTGIFGKPLTLSMLDPMEIFAAKTNALLERHAPRDLYDFNNMIAHNLFNDRIDLFRKSIIFYTSITASDVSADYDTHGIDQISFSKIRNELFPVLSNHEHFDVKSLVAASKKYIADLMADMTDKEKAYIDNFRSGSYQPELLFDDPDIISRIKDHPMALWRCRN